MRYKLAIVEDEAVELERMKEYIVRYGGNKGYDFEIVHFSDGAAFLKSYTPVYDAIFMDIVMPNLNGIAAAKMLRRADEKVPCVFITKMKHLAVKGYEVDALDFIVKPVAYDVFSSKMDKIMRVVKLREDKKVSFVENGTLVVLSSEEIIYVDVMNHDLVYHTQKKNYRVRKTLAAAESELKAHGFVRVSVCAIVNMRYIKEVKGDDIIMNGEIVHISRSKKKEFMQTLARWLGGYIV